MAMTSHTGALDLGPLDTPISPLEEGMPNDPFSLGFHDLEDLTFIAVDEPENEQAHWSTELLTEGLGDADLTELEKLFPKNKLPWPKNPPDSDITQEV